jgi:SAM-dependent methyltransferase
MPGTSSIPLHLRAIRAALRRINGHVEQQYRARSAKSRPMPGTPFQGEPSRAAERALRQLDLPDDSSRDYFEKHLARLARTLSLVPYGVAGSAVLELGCYMQLTPFLEWFSGYSRVRGADRGAAYQEVRKTASVGGKKFEAVLDLFDVERDRFPYQDGIYDTVLACELIEHLVFDPMHLLMECRRVLKDGGRLLLTTPNVGSLTAVARALHGFDNPQIYSKYSRPCDGEPPHPPHVREYTAHEIRQLMIAAGFEVESLLTEPLPEFEENLPVWNFLEENGYNPSLRGEQIYCLGVKRAGRPIDRYPDFLYAG